MIIVENTLALLWIIEVYINKDIKDVFKKNFAGTKKKESVFIT